MPPEDSTAGRTRSRSVRLGLFVLALIGAGVIALTVDWKTHGLTLLAWVQGLGPWGPIVFIVANSLSVMLLMPGLVFTLGGGFLFGLLEGTLYVVIGTSSGAIAAFLTARYLLSENVSRRLRRNRHFAVLDDAFSQESWKVIMLLRFIPMFPFKLSNYFFGVTRFSLRDFALGTTLGIFPLTVTNVYIGSLAKELAALGQSPPGPSTWAVYGAGLLVAVGVFIYLTRIARRALAEAIEPEAREDVPAAPWLEE